MMLTLIHTLGALDFSQVLEALQSSWFRSTLKIGLLIVIGWPLVYLLSVIVGKLVKGRTSSHVELILRKVVRFTGLVLLGAMILAELGFQLTAVLGAAGIISVAIGFAAQTSLSNLISGLFLYTERPFQIGDIVKVGDTMGVVLAIDLLSVKLRKFDNLFVRIPNETMIKVEVINLTRFPIRRLKVKVRAAYNEDVGKVMRVLKEVAQANAYVLESPSPFICLDSFGDFSLDFIVRLWFEGRNYLSLKKSILREIKERFDAEGIEIPIPQRGLKSASNTEPFPVKVVEVLDDSSAEPKVIP